MKKCPLNNFQPCDKECAWYLSKSECCSLVKLSKIHYNEYIVELKDIAENVSKIEDKFNQGLRVK